VNRVYQAFDLELSRSLDRLTCLTAALAVSADALALFRTIKRDLKAARRDRDLPGMRRALTDVATLIRALEARKLKRTGRAA